MAAARIREDSVEHREKEKHMNNLKKLFSPSALATTIATGMLLHATVAWAYQNCYSTSLGDSGGCPGMHQCYVSPGVYYCCPYGANCDDGLTTLYPCSSPPYYYCIFCLCPDEG